MSESRMRSRRRTAPASLCEASYLNVDAATLYITERGAGMAFLEISNGDARSG
jgi:hypothetical protein